MLRITIIYSLLLLMACQSKHSAIKADIIVLGHIYDWNAEGDKVDKRIEEIQFENFGQIWLGGDICAASSKNRSTLKYLDKLFDLGNSNTLWALGNHDLHEGNLENINEFTERSSFYRSSLGSIKIMVLNTQLEEPMLKDSCEWKVRQDEFINKTLDAYLSNDSITTVVLFTHNSIWEDCEPQTDRHERIGNQVSDWKKFLCQNKTQFRVRYFPKFKALRNQGKQVVFVAGDGGQYLKKFYEIGDSGIEYYVTGINNSVLKNEVKHDFNFNPDSILLFNIDEANKLEGHFESLDKLVE